MLHYISYLIVSLLHFLCMTINIKDIYAQHSQHSDGQNPMISVLAMHEDLWTSQSNRSHFKVNQNQIRVCLVSQNILSSYGLLFQEFVQTLED